jgi:phosphoenolpyruvate carboxykinase (GTP)
MSQIGVQLTDSPYVVVNMRIMARIGKKVFKLIDKNEKRVVPCMHTVGAPLAPGQKDVPWPCNKEKVHRPLPGDARDLELRLRLRRQRAARQEMLRAAHRLRMARDEGWMAEHMLILGVENPKGEKTYVAAAFPSACGKTNFAMLIPPAHFPEAGLEGVDRRRRHRVDQARRERPLRAINPEAGFFGVAPGTSKTTNPNAMAALAKNTIFTNVALTPTAACGGRA